MTVYHQMGDRYDNLLTEVSLIKYRGALLSPVNYSQESTKDLVAQRQRSTFEMVLDPQLYYPDSERGQIRSWQYFPSDVDTADLSDPNWWSTLAREVGRTAIDLGVGAVCSPALVPGSYSPDYYDMCRRVAVDLAAYMGGRAEILQTLIVNMGDLAEPGRSDEIASIVTEGDLSRVYLVLMPSGTPDRAFSKGSELKGAIQLIRLLEDNGVRVLVGFTASDLVLWKAAGANSCATGKHSGSRRFSSRRWDPPPRGGGGSISQWFEENLLAFVNELDVIKLRDAGLLSEASRRNPFGRSILNDIQAGQGEKWMSKGWRQFLYWFMDCEERLANEPGLAPKLVDNAIQQWQAVNNIGGLTGRVPAKGDWLVAWRDALK